MSSIAPAPETDYRCTGGSGSRTIKQGNGSILIGKTRKKNREEDEIGMRLLATTVAPLCHHYHALLPLPHPPVKQGGTMMAVQSAMSLPSYSNQGSCSSNQGQPQRRRVHIHQQDQTATATSTTTAMSTATATVISMGLLPSSFCEYFPVLHQPQQQQQQQQQANTATTARSTTTAAVGVLPLLRESFPLIQHVSSQSPAQQNVVVARGVATAITALSSRLRAVSNVGAAELQLQLSADVV